MNSLCLTWFSSQSQTNFKILNPTMGRELKKKKKKKISVKKKNRNKIEMIRNVEYYVIYNPD